MHLTYCEDFHTYPDYPVYGLPPCLGCSQSYLFPWVCMHPSSCKTVFSITASTIFLLTYNFIILYVHIQVHEIKIILIILVMCCNFWDYICKQLWYCTVHDELWPVMQCPSIYHCDQGFVFQNECCILTGYLDHKRKIKATYQYVVRESYWTNL